ncbi:hypothetical protein GCM10017562_64390 [Streptomyces roseofulvus]|uniref:hypothetical protein n=1 Tax=Streptomyces roseofulvus TaxID=33902 RepID=UPI0031FC3247
MTRSRNRAHPNDDGTPAHFAHLPADAPAQLLPARRWSAVPAVQFALGIVTGTVLSFEFIAVHLYGRRRLRPRTHFPLGPVPSVPPGASSPG